MRLLAALLLVCLPACAADVLGLYNGNNCIAGDTVQRFAAHCRCLQKRDYCADNEEMPARLESAAA